MIASLTGKIQHIASDRCIVDVNGVGYEVFLSTEGLSRLPEKGGEVFLHIHTNVREDAFILFGFDTRAEKEMFLTLKTVSGIGPKLSLAILSGMQVDSLCQAISMEDVKGLTTISGVGKKTAERICMELKDKVGNLQSTTSEVSQSAATPISGGNAVMDALSALVNLGYPDPVARETLAKVKQQVGGTAFTELKVEELIREGLRTLA
ncbi:MAG TPA: Holliday junction branch migration protein RuvA [Desulfocapsa sulfexigens]|nr:Holliday junction branch migration protein RuvA [Desulfocapsa sulfexigens]